MIGELLITDKHYAVSIGNGTSHTETAIYTSLGKLNEDWEDYDETETYFINAVGSVDINALADKRAKENFYKQLKVIGNYFETKEEAEKAVEKLRAWKRLKDKGFKSFSSNICGDDFVVTFKLTNHADYGQSMDDFDCIFDFGGEE